LHSEESRVRIEAMPTRALAGAELAESYPDLLAVLRGAPLTEALERLSLAAEQVAVPLSQAAAHLQVSVPTVRAWVVRGVLDEVSHSTVRSVSAASLGRALDAVHAVREAGDSKRELARVAERLRDEVLHKAALAAWEDRRRSGREATVVTDAELPCR
jgi:hypothetical protein